MMVAVSVPLFLTLILRFSTAFITMLRPYERVHFLDLYEASMVFNISNTGIVVRIPIKKNVKLSLNRPWRPIGL
jgi:hypothetical protein